MRQLYISRLERFPRRESVTNHHHRPPSIETSACPPLYSPRGTNISPLVPRESFSLSFFKRSLLFFLSFFPFFLNIDALCTKLENKRGRNDSADSGQPNFQFAAYYPGLPWRTRTFFEISADIPWNSGGRGLIRAP